MTYPTYFITFANTGAYLVLKIDTSVQSTPKTLENLFSGRTMQSKLNYIVKKLQRLCNLKSIFLFYSDISGKTYLLRI